MTRSARAFVLAVAMLAMLGPHTRAQGPTGAYVAVETWRSSGGAVPPALWRHPAGIAVTDAGLVVTTDAALGRGEVLDAGGMSQLVFGAADPGRLLAPGHVAVDEAGDRVYAADPGAARLQVFDLAGNHVATWDGFAGIRGVAVAPSGQVVVGDDGPPRVKILARDGSLIGGWQAGAPGGFTAVAGVHVHGATIYLADPTARRVFAYSMAGVRQGVWSIANRTFDGAALHDVYSDGVMLWVATDVGVARLDLARGHVAGVLTGIVAAAVDGRPDHGLFVAVTGGEGDPGVYRYSYQQSSGAPQTQWGGVITVPGLFDGLETLSFGADGAPYITDVPPRFQRLTSTGNPDMQVVGNDFVEVAADPGGRIFAAAGDSVHAFAPDGTPLWQQKVPTGSLGGQAMDIVGLGWDATTAHTLILEATSARLYALDATGAVAAERMLRPRRSSDAAWADLAVLADGSYAALDRGGGQVRGWDGTGRPNLEVDLAGRARHAARMDVLLDRSIVALSPDGWAHRIAPDGAVITAWDTTRLDLGTISRPADIAVDDAGRVYVLDGGADVITVYEWDPNATAPVPPTVQTGCQAFGHKQANPSEVVLGDAVEITLSIRDVCAAGREMVDYALIIDQSMPASSFRGVQRTVDKFLDRLDPASERVVVQAGRSSRLTPDLQLARRVLRRLDGGDTKWALNVVIDATAAELFGPRGRRDARKVVIYILASEGIPDNIMSREVYEHRRQIVRAGQQLKRRGAEAFGIWFGFGPPRTVAGVRQQGENTLRQIVTSRQHYFEGRSELHLAALQKEIQGRVVPDQSFRSLVITDELPQNMVLVEGSVRPPATVDGRILRWQLTDVPLRGIGLRLRVVPQAAGEWPTNVEATGRGQTPAGAEVEFVFPIPVVRVSVPHTPTPDQPTATTTPVATVTAEPTPTAATFTAYLPAALRQECAPTGIDVAMVLDASNSMAGDKLDAAVGATRAFLDRIALPSDRAAIVTFNAQATVLAELTGDRAALDSALDAITTAPGTRIDRGLEVAWDALRRGQTPERVAPLALIVLTDGRQSDEPARAHGIAADIRAAGVDVFVIGLGDDVDRPYLEDLAGSPQRFYYAPTAAGLDAIYRGLADMVRCH